MPRLFIAIDIPESIRRERRDMPKSDWLIQKSRGQRYKLANGQTPPCIQTPVPGTPYEHLPTSVSWSTTCSTTSLGFRTKSQQFDLRLVPLPSKSSDRSGNVCYSAMRPCPKGDAPRTSRKTMPKAVTRTSESLSRRKPQTPFLLAFHQMALPSFVAFLRVSELHCGTRLREYIHHAPRTNECLDERRTRPSLSLR